MKTFTPKLDPAVLARLRQYAARFASDFPQSKPARWAGVYLHGLLTDGERKSIEPLSRRVTLPESLTSKDPEQALQQFVIRRALQRLLLPLARPDCHYCRDQRSLLLTE